VIALLRSLRALIFGETWTIPLGIAATVAIAVLLRSLLPDHLWHEAGGFALAGMVATTLVTSISRSSRTGP
jgi:hypothetical protein